MITVQNLTFAYSSSHDNIFENASFTIDASWKLGFIGRNGRGKTTFFNLLLGKYEYQGKIHAPGIHFAYFPYPVEDPTLTTEAIALQIVPDHQTWQLIKELSLLKVSEDVLYRPFNTLSSGEQTKVLLAILFTEENNFLLIDEPTNHLDTHGRELLGRYLKSKDNYILISHDRALLDTAVDHILSINRANIEVQRGNYTSWHHNKQQQDSYEMAENTRLRKDIKRLEKAAKQSQAWADHAESTKIGLKGGEKSMDRRAYIGEKSRRMQQRRKNLENRQNTAISEKSHLLKNIDETDALKITQLPYHKKNLVSAEDLAIHYHQDQPICQDVSFTIDQGDRISIQGQNGSGKSSIIKLICGADVPHTGTLTMASGLKISYVPQDTSFLKGNLKTYATDNDIDESFFKAILRKLGFSREQFDKDMVDFSHGQKKKTLIAKSLSEKSHILIWDEPLNFIDLLSRLQIESLILGHSPTILFVEHDKVFVEKIATKIIQL